MIKKQHWTIGSYLSSQSTYSRRDILALVTAGYLKVNNKTIDSILHPIDPKKDRVTAKDKHIRYRHPLVYYKFNKPRHVITTLHDPKGRQNISDYLKKISEPVFPVGRLDRDTSGLLLLTNDGEFAHRIMHPSQKVPKTYILRLDQAISKSVIERLDSGFFLEDGPVKFDSIIQHTENELTVVISEGRNRLIRRSFQFFGLTVKKLARVAIDSVVLGPLKEGQCKLLSRSELKGLLCIGTVPH